MKGLRPLTIPIDEAVAFAGCKGRQQFKREIKKGRWPKACVPNSRPPRWSVAEMEARMERRSNRTTDEEEKEEKEELDRMAGLI